jgi:2-dehydropantoate 2-reductase
MDATTRDPRTQELIRNLMRECLKVGSALGVQSNVDVDERIASFATAAPFRPSMLQDLEAGKTLEIDPLVAAILELGKLAEVPTPLTDAIYALVRRLAESKGLYALS